MTALGGWAKPGIGALLATTEREILWGTDDSRLLAIRKSAVISGATRDAGNSPTTILRAGLILGKVTSTGEYEEYDSDATDGTQIAEVILNREFRAQDFDANNVDRVAEVLAGGLVRADQLLLLDGQARQQLSPRFLFDDDLFGRYTRLGMPLTNVQVTGNTTVTAAQTGSRFVSTGADVAFTLPTLAIGLVYEFLMAADQELVVQSVAGDDIVVGNDLSADKVTFTTASEQIGALVRVESIYVTTTLKWLMTLPAAPFGTGTATLTYGITS